MPTTFRRYEPDQMLLPPTDLREWLPDGRLALSVRRLQRLWAA